jgi:hypothetical protein
VPIGARQARRSPELLAVKETVRRLLGLDDDTAVVVRELACAEPGCPPLETVIAVLPADGPRRQWKLHVPLTQVTETDLRELVTPSPEGA